MSEKDLTSETVESESENEIQQTVELQPLLSSQQQHEHMEDDKVIIDMNQMIENSEDGVLSSECCIYRVPLMLRHLNENTYTPRSVSIGPFHYGDKRLEEMQKHKQIMLKRFIRRAESSLDDLVGLVKDLEPKVRASYSEPIDLDEEGLVKLTLLDAAFIIELFIVTCMTNKVDFRTDAKFSQLWFHTSIFIDLILLENQLPFHIIEELFNKAFPELHRKLSFRRLACWYFAHNIFQGTMLDPCVEISHFTDLLRLFYVRSERKPLTGRQPFSRAVGNQNNLLYTVNALKEAGIKLKASKSKCLFDFNFSRHTLEIPPVQVDAYTKLYFANVIALEQCHYPNDAYFSGYALIWDWLIGTSKDVDILVSNEIFINYTGDTNNAASLFNSLPEYVLYFTIIDEHNEICKRLSSYCQNPWHQLKTTLRRDHCRTPWQIVALIAAIVLLMLTVVQTIFSILQVTAK